MSIVLYQNQTVVAVYKSYGACNLHANQAFEKGRCIEANSFWTQEWEGDTLVRTGVFFKTADKHGIDFKILKERDGASLY